MSEFDWGTAFENFYNNTLRPTEYIQQLERERDHYRNQATHLKEVLAAITRIAFGTIRTPKHGWDMLWRIRLILRSTGPAKRHRLAMAVLDEMGEYTEEDFWRIAKELKERREQ